ncbi:MAG: hypothetical protein JSS36_11360 [Proteobacteria bacterium]|nr:hypothetical protein [Pseudomonadota bacterium]
MNAPATAAAAEAAERRFFRNLALGWALVIVAGFLNQLLAGRSSFHSPLIVHVHAFVFFGWVALFVTQNLAVAGGNMALHRRLGWLGLVWPPVMVAVGITVMIHAMKKDGGPFFFGAAEFMFSNPLSLITFMVLVFAAVALRRRTDWHRRLMISAVVPISGPGFGRLLPAPLLIPWAWQITGEVGIVFILAGMLRDRRHHGRVHPAWWVGLAAAIGWMVLGEAVASTQWAQDLTRQVIAGTPGANRPMAPYTP